MTLFALLLALALERLFKLGNHWCAGRWLTDFFHYMLPPSNYKTALLLSITLLLLWLVFLLLHGWLFGLFTLLLIILLCWLCIGPGVIRQHYRHYLLTLQPTTQQADIAITDTLITFYQADIVQSSTSAVITLRNALIWINYRYYLAPIFWLIIPGKLGPLIMTGYCLLRAYQRWLTQQVSAEQYHNSAIDTLLFWFDWLPVRCAALLYALSDQKETALPFWLKNISNIRLSPYLLLTQIAQIALVKKSDSDPIATPLAAVALAKRVTIGMLLLAGIITFAHLL